MVIKITGVSDEAKLRQPI